MDKITVVIPVYYNELSIPSLYDTLFGLAEKANPRVIEFEWIFVDDGSGDGSYELLQELQEKDSRVTVIKLASNHGSHTAVLAGLQYVTGDCVTIISADLQDPPELILEMYDKWKKGSPIVLGVREDREESLVQKFFSNTYYKLMRKYAISTMPNGGFDYVLMDRKVSNIVSLIKEKNTSIMGLILWTGYRFETIPYTRRKRKLGKSRWTLRKKIKLFIDSFIAFSYTPVRFMSLIGLILFICSILYGLFLIISYLFMDQKIQGWTSLMVILVFLSAVQFLSFGIIGEYLWRTLDAARGRPTYVIESVLQTAASNERQTDGVNDMNRREVINHA